VLSQRNAVEMVAEWLPEWRQNRTDMDNLDLWYRGRQDLPKGGKQPTVEHRRLQEYSIGPHLRLVVNVTIQGLAVDGYRPQASSENAAPWSAWQANQLDKHQVSVYRGAASLGAAYTVTLPGDPYPQIRAYSRRSMIAAYADPFDEWPAFAMWGRRSGDKFLLRLIDESHIYYLEGDSVSGAPKFIEAREHNTGVCPVVRFTAGLDLDGRVMGEVEPYIPIAARIDQTTYDRLVVQRHNSWKVRTVAGMAKPATDEEERAAKRLLEVGDLLVSGSPDTKFGTLDGTPLDGYIKAKEADYRELAAVSQTPPVDLLGQVANLSAEALAEARYAAQQKKNELKLSLGESWEQNFRLVGAQMGDEDAAEDFEAQVVWRNEERSLAQSADALGKLSQMLGVPPRALWERIPGVTQQDVVAWERMAADDDSLGDLARLLSGQMTDVVDS